MTLNKSSRLGLYAVVLMASRPDELISAATVAQEFEVSEDHVAKVLQQLVRARIVRGVRGVGGGYRLEVSPRALTMLAVVEAIEGPLRPGCYGCEAHGEGQRECRHAASCAIRGVLEEIGHYAWITLQSVTIATLAAGTARARTRNGGGPALPV